MVYLPEMAITMVRRTTAKLPYNHFLFRTEPKWTKLEIKEYLQKIYGVKVARIATSVQLGTLVISADVRTKPFTDSRCNCRKDKEDSR